MRPFNDRLAEFAHLKDGWDGTRSMAPSEEAIRTCANFVPVPLCNGGIQVEVHAGGADVEIEIDAAGKIISVSWTRA